MKQEERVEAYNVITQFFSDSNLDNESKEEAQGHLNKLDGEIKRGEQMDCCGKKWAFENKQTLSTDVEVRQAVCLKCGGFERHVIGQLDKEELENYRDE